MEDLYEKVFYFGNLFMAWKKARKHKTKKYYVIEFEKNASVMSNLAQLYKELKYQAYSPKPLKTFIIRDPKTRKISKSAFRDRIVHHALCRIIEPIFEKKFIYDCCANIKLKGNLFALERFDCFKRKVTNNLTSKAYCLKADIKHYFETVDHEILISIIQKTIKDERVIWLIRKILDNYESKEKRKGMPLGNLTSQFFANVYLNELDQYVKHELKAKYYIRYVDDFVILHKSEEQLKIWKEQIDNFLKEKLNIELHPDKSKIVLLSKGVDFVGFRNYYHFRLLRKRNIRKIRSKIRIYTDGKMTQEIIQSSFNGWQAYASWSNSYKLICKLNKTICESISYTINTK